jgi:uncharacterized membrane protein YkoI
MRGIVGLLSACLVAGLVVLAPVAQGQEKGKDKPKAEKIAPDKLPQKILKAVKDRFPDAKITSAEKEIENGEVVYDIELTNKGRKHEMDIKADGTVVQIENEVAVKDLPKAVTKAINTKHPKCKIEEVMEVNNVKGAVVTPAHYEVVIVTAAGKKMELEVSLDGKTVKGGADK